MTSLVDLRLTRWRGTSDSVVEASFPWTQLTSICLDSYYGLPEPLLRLLERCPNLVTFELCGRTIAEEPWDNFMGPETDLDLVIASLPSTAKTPPLRLLGHHTHDDAVDPGTSATRAPFVASILAKQPRHHGFFGTLEASGQDIEVVVQAVEKCRGTLVDVYGQASSSRDAPDQLPQFQLLQEAKPSPGGPHLRRLPPILRPHLKELVIENVRLDPGLAGRLIESRNEEIGDSTKSSPLKMLRVSYWEGAGWSLNEKTTAALPLTAL
ncbi:hypothetical protein BDV98DRAFT_561449 [Pterulicium gracile]|uniref:F-box domain-containing protein n=1 Tax=Pterulicium gracile TaxID=1884261 RepID=A0A5C3QSV8_9AGAR|nr:hypothetical protein BDV98DRAFT_561449 [Pterula gracilis]